MIIFASTSNNSCLTDILNVSQKASQKGYSLQSVRTGDNNNIYRSVIRTDSSDESMPICTDGMAGIISCCRPNTLVSNDNNHMPSDRYAAAVIGEISNEAITSNRLEIPCTGSESIIPALIEKIGEGSTILQALKMALTYLDGNFSFVLFEKGSSTIYAVNSGRTLYAGIGEKGGAVASDIWTLSPFAAKIFALERGEIAVVTPEKVALYDMKLRKIKRSPRQFRLSGEEGSFGYTDRLKKEIFSCPGSVESTCKGLLESGKLTMPSIKIHFSNLKRIYMIGSGESYAVAVAAKENFEAITDIPSYALPSSEFCCSNPILDKSTLVIAISQSGENLDAISAARMARECKSQTLALTNTPYSTLARMCKSSLLTSSGYESAQINAKFFPAAYTLISLLALDVGKKTAGITDLFMNVAVKTASSLPDKIRLVLKCEREINVMAKRISGARKIILTGQNVDYATAIQGAVTITATAGADCTAIQAGEIKSLLPSIDSGTAVIGLVSCNALFNPTLTALSRSKLKGARTFIIMPDTMVEHSGYADCILPYCDSIPLLNPAVEETALQLLAYGMQSFEESKDAV